MARDSLAQVWKEYEDYLISGDDTKDDRTYFPTGLIGLNAAIGHPEGMTSGLIEIIGAEGRGKTTLALDILAHSQQRGLKMITAPNGKQYNAMFLDFERTYDAKYAKTLGVDTEHVLVIVAPSAEVTFNIAEKMLETGIQFVIVDSIPMVVPMAELEKTYEDSPKMAAEAALLGRAVKRFNQLSATSDALIILLNQWRANISPMARTNKKPYGAYIVSHVVQVIIELERIERKNTWMTIEAFVSKTKQGATGRKIQYRMIHGKGIDYAGYIIDVAVDLGIVEKGGAYYYYPDKKNFTHRVQGKERIAELPLDEIKLKVIDAMKDMKVEDEDESITE